MLMPRLRTATEAVGFVRQGKCEPSKA